MMRAEFIEDRGTSRCLASCADASYEVERTAGGTCVLSPKASSGRRSSSEVLDSLLQHQQQLFAERALVIEERETHCQQDHISMSPSSRSNRSNRSSPSTPRSVPPSPSRQAKAIRFPRVDNSDCSTSCSAITDSSVLSSSILATGTGRKREVPTESVEDLFSSNARAEVVTGSSIEEQPFTDANANPPLQSEGTDGRERAQSSQSIMDRIRRCLSLFFQMNYIFIRLFNISIFIFISL